MKKEQLNYLINEVNAANNIQQNIHNPMDNMPYGLKNKSPIFKQDDRPPAEAAQKQHFLINE